MSITKADIQTALARPVNGCLAFQRRHPSSKPMANPTATLLRLRDQAGRRHGRDLLLP